LRAIGALILCAIAACGGEATADHTGRPDAPDSIRAPEAGAESFSVTTAGLGTTDSVSRISVSGQLSDSISASRLSAIATAAARVAPAVVSVNVVRRQRQVARTIWEQFWMPRGSERLVEGLGSGFIVTVDGVVITNQHVTEGAEEIVVTSRDGTDYEAELLGEDPLTDIAVLKIEGPRLPVVELGSSHDLIIGEWVVAIGNPYGYLLGNSEPTVTAGVVSAVGRDLIPSGDDAGIYVGMIQTDAAINPGNSGGPLVNALGQVVGVNSSIFSSSGGSVGIGFAIPIERAVRVSRELQRFGTIRRSWVGLDVAGQDRLRDWKETGGLEITRVAPGSPAERSGLRAGDVIVTALEQPTRTFLDWEGIKLDVGPGDSIPMAVSRSNRERRVVVLVEDLPTTRAERISTLGDMQLITVTPAIQQERGLRSEQGALIYSIGGAARVGLGEGDVIVQINRQRISRAEQVTDIFRRVQGTRTPLRVWVERQSRLFYLDFYVR
jgi:serine protease Do